MDKMGTLEWNVILPRPTAFYYNIFNSIRFRNALMNLKYTAKKEKMFDLKEGLRQILMYCFWCKAEFEVLIKGLFDSETHKVDVYSQIIPNFDKLHNYILENWKTIPAKSYKQQRREKDGN